MAWRGQGSIPLSSTPNPQVRGLQRLLGGAVGSCERSQLATLATSTSRRPRVSTCGSTTGAHGRGSDAVAASAGGAARARRRYLRRRDARPATLLQVAAELDVRGRCSARWTWRWRNDATDAADASGSGVSGSAEPRSRRGSRHSGAVDPVCVAHARGRVTRRIEGDEAWAIIDLETAAATEPIRQPRSLSLSRPAAQRSGTRATSAGGMTRHPNKVVRS
jgi:hypothetical protein